MLLPEIDPEILLFKKKSDYLTDPSDSDNADMFTSQVTQGYSEGLADNELESEVSSVFGLGPFSTRFAFALLGKSSTEGSRAKILDISDSSL